MLTNPPFGTKGANQAPDREDFTIETSNKQLNFLQHVVQILKPSGRAAIVLPDNCLFEGKAGEVFNLVMEDCNVHSILRLPRGTFSPYSQGAALILGPNHHLASFSIREKSRSFLGRNRDAKTS